MTGLTTPDSTTSFLSTPRPPSAATRGRGRVTVATPPNDHDAGFLAGGINRSRSRTRPTRRCRCASGQFRETVRAARRATIPILLTANRSVDMAAFAVGVVDFFYLADYLLMDNSLRLRRRLMDDVDLTSLTVDEFTFRFVLVRLGQFRHEHAGLSGDRDVQIFLVSSAPEPTLPRASQHVDVSTELHRDV